MERAIAYKKPAAPRLLSVKDGVYKYQMKYNVVTIDTPRIFRTASQILKKMENNFIYDKLVRDENDFHGQLY